MGRCKFSSAPSLSLSSTCANQIVLASQALQRLPIRDRLPFVQQVQRTSTASFAAACRMALPFVTASICVEESKQ